MDTRTHLMSKRPWTCRYVRYVSFFFSHFFFSCYMQVVSLSALRISTPLGNSRESISILFSALSSSPSVVYKYVPL